MRVNKPSAIADKPFRAMNVNPSKERSFYTQGQQFAARILFIVWLLASISPEGILATPKRQMVPSTTISPGDPSIVSTPSTPLPEDQLTPDSPGAFWGDNAASSPSMDAALQSASSLRARTLDKLAGRLWRPRTQETLRNPAGPVAEGDEAGSNPSTPSTPHEAGASSQSPAVTPSLADPAQAQASELTKKLVSLYSADDKLPKLIEDDSIPEQDIGKYYVKLQAVVQEQAESAESAAARDKVVGEKRAIKIEAIFDELDKEGSEPIGKVLLLGGAGIGKTTLMHYISHQWARGKLWEGKYAYLFRVRLKELLNDSWQAAYSTDDLDEHPLACFIHHCLRNQRTQLPLPRSKRKAFKLCSLEEIKKLLEDSASQHSVLLLVDGYDEIASQSHQGIVKDIVDEILERGRVIMTSRPNAADKKLRSAFGRQVESQGLDRTGIDQYIDLQFGEDQAGQDLKDFLTNNRQILGMCEVPINTALLCIIWQDEEFREKLQAQSGEDLKLGELYEALVVWLGKRYMKKFQDRDHENLTEEIILSHPVVKTLKEVAYTSFTGEGKEQAAGTLGIAGAYIANTAEKQETKIESVYQYGLLRAEGAEKELIKKTHYFIHLTFQEYLTALRLSEALSQGDGVREVATHLAEHRNEPRYLMTLKFLAGLVSKSEDTALVQRFWEAVSCNVEGVLELGVASKVGLLMHLMAQSTTSGKLDERIPNREQLQKLVDEELVTDLARWQEQIIASGYKSAALVTKLCEVIYREQLKDISTLSAALEIGLALGIQVVEEEEQPIAGRLEKLLDSSVWQVQALAAAKLAQVLDDTVDPAQTSRLLSKLVGLYKKANTKQGALAGIRRLAELKADIVVEELRKSVVHGSAGDRKTVQGLADELAAGSSQQLAKQFSELGQAWLESTYPEVRLRALTLMEKLLAIDAGLAPQLLEAAMTGIKDSDEDVRSSALTLMEKLLSIDAGLATDLLEAAKTGIKDAGFFGNVQLRALTLMEKLLSIDAGLAPQLLEAAKTGLKDSSFFGSSVHSSALTLMEKLLSIDAGLATDLLEAAMTGINHWHSSVRSSALSLIDKLLSIDAGLATDLLEATGLKDKHGAVRSSALTLMAKLLSIDAELAPDLLEAAMTGIKDSDEDVRSSALTLMEKLLSIDAGLAPQLIEAAKTGIKDASSSVRSSALTLIDKLLSIDAGLATDLLEAAMTGIKDASSSVRSSALTLIDKLLSIDAGLATDLLEAAMTGIKDSDSSVRSSALTLMEKLLSIDAGLAPDLLEAAMTGIKDEGWRVRQSALTLMEKLLSIDAGLAPDLLEAAMTGIKDEGWRVRQSALTLMEKLLSIDAGLAPQLIEAAKTGLKDADPDVRSSALTLMEKLLSIDAGLAPDLLEAAKTGVKDQSWRVWSSALTLMEKLLSIDAGLAPDLLEAAKTGLKDADSSVRSSALTLMEKLLSIDAGLAPDLLEAAKTGLKDADPDVRSSALTLMEKLLSIDAGLAPDLLEAAKTGLKDADSSVRSSALTLMEKLLSIDAGLAPDLLEAAKTGIKDANRSVRSSALTLMEKLLSIDAGLAPDLLEAAKTGLKDANRSVRSSALTLMEKLLSIDAGLAPDLLEAAKTGLKDADPLGNVRSSALTLMEKLLSIDAGLAPDLLEAAKTGIKDADPLGNVRSSALTLMEKLLSIDAGLAPDLLEAAKTGLKDSESSVRSSALSLMEKLLAIDAGLAPDLLEAAKTGIKDADPLDNVRSSALTLIDKLLAIDAGLAPDLLKAAKTGLKDSSFFGSSVRSSALSLMEKLLSIDAGLAPDLLEAAKTGLKDYSFFGSSVQPSALTLIDKLLSIDAGLAPDLLEAAKTGIKDANRSVRSSALTLMEKLLSIDAGLAPDLLEAAKTGIKDADSSVRSSALSLMEKLLEADAALAQELLEAVQKGLKDKYVSVRWKAFELLKKLAEALDKPEIEQNALNQLKAQLKKETWRITKSALQTALTFTKLIPASAQQWLELVPYGLRDEESETQEAAISLGVELAFHLPDEPIIPMLLEDPEPAVRNKAKEHFTKRLQDKTVNYSPKDALVLDQLLQHSTTDSELDQSLQKEITQKLLELAPQVAEEAGLKYLNEHFDALSHSPAITAFLKKVMHQTLADNAIDQLEAELITKCILEHGITATIAPGKRLFVLEDSRYGLEDRPEASLQANLQHIVNIVIKESPSKLARQYKTHQPLFENTGSGLPIAASDIASAVSLVNDKAELSASTWHLSVMHLSDHHKQEPQDTFLLLEQRNYVGEHIIKKITYDQGQYTLAYDQALNPKAIDTTLRKELFGPMEYEGTKPRYYATCYTLSKEAAQELLGNINKQAKKEAQDAYQALHQLALAACQADQNAAGSKQLALEWRAYAPNAQELKKADLLQLNPEDAAQVRRDSLAFAEREEVAALSKRFESLESILDVTGIASKAEIKEKLAALQESNPKLYDYCHTFIWTMSRYIAANGIASTDMFSQELDQSTKEAIGMGLVKAGMSAAESVPFVGEFAGLLGNLIDAAYEGVKTAQQENKTAVLNRIIQDNHIFPEDADLTISRAGLLLAERKREEIEAGQASAQSILGSLGSKIKEFKNWIVGNYNLKQSPQANLAIEDVLTLLVRMYKEYETLNRQGGVLYKQLAELVCMGSLSDLLSKSTAVTQKDAAIAQAASALKAPTISTAVTQKDEDIAQAESALKAPTISTAVTQKDEDIAQAEGALKSTTISKLRQKAGKGLWKAATLRKCTLCLGVESKNCEEFFEEACVRGYIAESQPGVAVSANQLVAMRMVLFLHMCKGIQESRQQPLACAKKFAAKYPALVEKLAKEYPTYFVSQAIARACIKDPSLADEVVSRLPS